MKTKLPKRIVINDGELQMSDGSNLAAYLKKWQKKNSVDNGQYMCVTTRESMSRLRSDAILFRNFGS
jgi:hypothetical protein